MKTETINFDTAGGPSSAYVAIPDSGPNDKAAGKAVVLVQEWWGLNAHIKDIAGRYAKEGFTCIAPDLYHGKLAQDAAEAGQLMQGLALSDGLDTIKNAMARARETYGIKKFCITGYCMGGTYALRAACVLDGLVAAAPFYGDVPEDALLEKLKVPTIFFSGKKDQWINTEKVAALEETAREFGLPLQSVAYDADHAFFNDTRPEVYDADAAADAWKKVLHFFNLNY